VYCLVPDSGAEDINKAVEAAQRAFPVWSKLSAQRRSELLYKVANLIEERLDEFAAAESRDQGSLFSEMSSSSVLILFSYR